LLSQREKKKGGEKKGQQTEWAMGGQRDGDLCSVPRGVRAAEGGNSEEEAKKRREKLVHTLGWGRVTAIIRKTECQRTTGSSSGKRKRQHRITRQGGFMEGKGGKSGPSRFPFERKREGKKDPARLRGGGNRKKGGKQRRLFLSNSSRGKKKNFFFADAQRGEGAATCFMRRKEKEPLKFGKNRIEQRGGRK